MVDLFRIFFAILIRQKGLCNTEIYVATFAARMDSQSSPWGDLYSALSSCNGGAVVIDIDYHRFM